MSKKAAGSLIIAPDSPVIRHSEEMESCFEMLHREVWTWRKVPDSIDSVIGGVKQLRQHYYNMRDYLEADYGISQEVVDALPLIELDQLLKMLYSWEVDIEVGLREFNLRSPQNTEQSLYTNPSDRFYNYADCWKQYRLWIFEANRALSLSRERISHEFSNYQPRRYYWLNE